MPKTDQVIVESENDKVVKYQTTELVKVGYPERMAKELAENPQVDWHHAIKLIERGCSVQTAFKILI